MRPLIAVPAGEAVLPALVAAIDGGPAVFVGDAAPQPEVDDAVALVVETSGSSGRPKRVALSSDAILANGRASNERLGSGRWVLALPTHYIAGINVLARSITAGTSPSAVQGSHFTAKGFLDAADGCDYLAIVPAQLATLLSDPAATEVLAGFRAVLVGGQATPHPLLQSALDAGIRIVRSYGSSETSGGCVYDGVPIGDTRVAIVDGEVRIASSSLALGYLGDPELTAERFVESDGARWFRTADAGSFHDGVLSVTGRRDDVIISGGLKVSLGAVERVVQSVYPDAAVVGVPDDRWGERAVAFTEFAESDDAALTERLVAELGPAARAAIMHVDDLPRLASGKPDRMALRARAAKGAV